MDKGWLGWTKGVAAVVVAWGALIGTCRVPVWHSDAEAETVGRMWHCGLPIPWRISAPGFAWAQTVWWLMPVNLALWVLAACFLFRVRSWRSRAVCLAAAEMIWVVLLV